MQSLITFRVVGVWFMGVMLLSFCHWVTALLDVNFISIMPKNTPIGGALMWTGAPLDLAAEEVRRRYAGHLNLTVTLLYDEKDRKCDTSDASAPLLLADYYYRQGLNRCLAVMAASCGGLSVAPYLAKEWDVLLFANAMVTTSVFNSVTAPTATGMSGSYEGLAVAMLQLFRSFGWFHVTLFLDSIATTDYYIQSIQAVMSVARSSQIYSDFRLDSYTFSPADLQSMIVALRLAHARSRVFLIQSHTSVLIKLLRTIAASGIDMSEKHVFLVIQSVQQPAYGAATLFDHPKLEDLPLFDTVLYLTTYGGSTDNKTDELNNLLIDREKTQYGSVFDPGTKPLDISYAIRETYSSLLLFAELVNESHSGLNQTETSQGPCSGRELKSLMRNKTFSFPSGDVYIDPEGARHADLLVYAFHRKQHKMQVAGVYDSSTNGYIWDDQYKEWFIPMDGVPADVPPCGFSGFADACRLRGSTGIASNPAYMTPILVGALLATIVVIVGIRRLLIQYGVIATALWWRMPVQISPDVPPYLHPHGHYYGNHPTLCLFGTKVVDSAASEVVI